MSCECTLQDFFTKRWNLLTGVLYFVFRDFDEKYFSLGRIKGIRSFHQFELSNDGTHTVEKYRTQSTMRYLIFGKMMMTTIKNKNRLYNQLKAFEDITVEKFVLVEHDNKRYLARVCALGKVHQIARSSMLQASFSIFI